MTGVLLPVKPYARRRPPNPYNPGFFDQEFQNIQQSIASITGQNALGIANVLDYPGRSGWDITKQILNALGDTGAAWIPPGNWVTSANITLPVGSCLFGVPWWTVLNPTNDLNGEEVITMGGSTTLKGIRLVGSSTSGAIGVGAGNDQLISNAVISDLDIRSFVGSSARGMKLGRLVTGNFQNIFAAFNEHGLECDGGDTPTDVDIDNCQWCFSVHKGVWFKTGIGVNFNKNLFQSNREEGLYFQNAAGTAVEIRILKPWFEGNWASLAAGVSRHAQYELYCDGATGPSGTIRLAVRDGYFNIGATSAKAMHLTNAIGYLVDNCSVFNEAANILVDGSSYGKFENWPEQSGDIRTVVSVGSSASAWNDRQHIEDIEAAFTDWVPTITASGAMTIASPVVTEARYKITGKTLKIENLNISFTTGGVAAATIIVTLPTNARTKNANAYRGGAVALDPGTIAAYCQANGNSPTSSLKFNKIGDAVWGIGASRQILFSGEFELF